MSVHVAPINHREDGSGHPSADDKPGDAGGRNNDVQADVVIPVQRVCLGVLAALRDVRRIEQPGVVER